MALDKSNILGLCFDVDGTLRDTDDQFVARLSNWLHPFRILLPDSNPQAFARRVVMSTEYPGNFVLGLADRLHLDRSLAKLGDFTYRVGLGENTDGYRLVLGVTEMLRRLKPLFPMSIVSARGERTTLSFLEKFELRDFFTSVATALTCLHTKPFPDPIIWAAEQMDIPVKNCLMIGDTRVDIQAAKAAGAQSAAVLCGFGEEQELHKYGADIILDTTSDLAEVLINNHES